MGVLFSSQEKTTIFDIINREDWIHAKDLPWDKIDEINFVDERLMQITRSNIELILTRCGKHLKKLMILDSFNPSITPVLREHCYNVKTLGLLLYSLNTNDIIEAWEKMEKLDSIALYVSRDRVETAIFDFSKILHSLPEGIITIKLSSLMHEHSASAKKIPKLQISLDKFSCLRNLILKMFKLDNHVIEEISKRKSLEFLSLECCTVKPETLFPLNLPNLLSLKLRKMNNIDNCLINIANESKNLRSLDIKYCQKVSVIALRKLSNLKNLIALDFSGVKSVDDGVITVIANECQELKGFGLSRCTSISTDGFRKLAHLKNLEELDLSHTHLVGSAIVGITISCTKLKVLSLEFCKNIPEYALRKIGNLPHLETLSVVSVENIEDSILLNLCNLKHLDCDSCHKVTDSGIENIIKNSPNLETLIAYDTKVTFESLNFAEKYVKNRKNNITLNFYVNTEVTSYYFLMNHYYYFKSPLLDIYSRYTSDYQKQYTMCFTNKKNK